MYCFPLNGNIQNDKQPLSRVTKPDQHSLKKKKHEDKKITWMPNNNIYIYIILYICFSYDSVGVLAESIAFYIFLKKAKHKKKWGWKCVSQKRAINIT